MHQDDPLRDELLRALVDGFNRIDPELAGEYIERVLAGMADAAARSYLEDLMETIPNVYRGRFGQQKYDEGMAVGKAEGKAESIITVLVARKLKVPAKVRERVEGCTDPAQLTSWLERAATVSSADELFG